jgi:hypothetical protein
MNFDSSTYLGSTPRCIRQRKSSPYSNYHPSQCTTERTKGDSHHSFTTTTTSKGDCGTRNSLSQQHNRSLHPTHKAPCTSMQNKSEYSRRATGNQLCSPCSNAPTLHRSNQAHFTTCHSSSKHRNAPMINSHQFCPTPPFQQPPLHQPRGNQQSNSTLTKMPSHHSNFV